MVPPVTIDADAVAGSRIMLRAAAARAGPLARA
jgi:hypothetical protein